MTGSRLFEEEQSLRRDRDNSALFFDKARLELYHLHIMSLSFRCEGGNNLDIIGWVGGSEQKIGIFSG